MDYKKWDDMEDDIDENAEDNGFRGLLAMKAAADGIFDEGCHDDTKYGHCLSLYLKICDNLDTRSKESKISQLFVPCQLNIACCQLMLKQWDNCIDICQRMLEMKPSILTTAQNLRCHYFRACSYLQRNSSPNDKERALESSSIIQNIVRTQQNDLADEAINEYNELHCKLVSTSNILAMMPSHGFTNLLANGQFKEAKSFFSDFLKDYCSRSNSVPEDDRSAVRKLQMSIAEAWEGRGIASVGLGELAEASDAFERAGNIIAELIYAQDVSESTLTVAENEDSCDGRLRHRDKSREMLLLAASASVLYFQREKSQTSMYNYPATIIFAINSSSRDCPTIGFQSSASAGFRSPEGRLHKAASLFKKVVLLPAKQDYKSECDRFCSFIATAGLGYCYAMACDLPEAMKKLNVAITEGVELLSLMTRGVIQLDSKPMHREEPTIEELLPDTLNKVCLYPVVAVALALEPSGLCQNLDPSVVFVTVAECYWVTIAILKHMKKWDKVRSVAENAVEFMGSHRDSEKFQIENRSDHLLRLTVSFLMSLSACLEQIDCVDVDDVHVVLESLCEKALILDNQKCHREAYRVYSWCGNIFRKFSGILPFVLDDKILHTENHAGAESAGRAVDMYGLAVNSCIKNIARCKKALDLDEGKGPLSSQLENELVSEVYSSYCDLIQLHLFRGVCAPNRGLAQRFLESAHTAREEYVRLCHMTGDKKMPSLLSKFIGKDDETRNALKALHGEISFYLAYTYLRSGKIKYAIEEARAAVDAFESMTLSENGANAELFSEFNNSKRIKLRHAWGLVAVVTCNMGEDEVTTKESQHALRMVRQLDIGPVQDSSGELERLEKVLELNRTSSSSRGGDRDRDCCNGSIQAVNSSHARKLLHRNWAAGSEQEMNTSKTTGTTSPSKANPKIQLPTPKPDFNLLVAFFILSIVLTVILLLSYNVMTYYFFSSEL